MERHLIVAAGLLILVGCAQNDAGVTGVGAGLSIDVEYVERGPDANVYSVKYICGETETDHPLVRAIYRTEISTINPSSADADTASFSYRWRVAFVYPGTPPATLPVEVIRGPYRGDEINCRDIRHQLAEAGHDPDHAIPPDTPLLKGFVVIESDSDRLRVAAVYSTLHKQIHGKRIADLVPRSACEMIEGALQVAVSNQGEGQAPTTTTLVEIDGSPPVERATEGLDPDEEVDLDPVPLPEPEADSIAYRVVADANDVVDEADEGNNELLVTCEFAG